MSEVYLKVGGYTPENEEQEAIIEREYYRQGWIFKDEEAFLLYPDQACYVPELFDSSYTQQDFLNLCNGQEKFAWECFYSVDWQSPETWVEEQYRDNEWGYCPHCEEIYDMAGEPCACPVCGWKPENLGGENGNTESECRPAESGGL